MHIPLSIDRSRGVPIQIQLVDGIRDLIGQGAIRPDIRLPATRALSRQLRVSRNTVKIAYYELMSQGYLRSKGTSGTYSCVVMPEPAVKALPRDVPPTVMTQANGHALNKVPSLIYSPQKSGVYDFSLTREDPAIAPERTWRRLMLKHMPYRSRHSSSMDSSGLLLLREAIASSISPLRGMSVNVGNSYIISNDYRAFDIVNRAMLNPGARVVVEDPCDVGLLYLLKCCRAEVVAVPVDDEGIVIDELPLGKVSLIYVSPSHQIPTGATMSLVRRQQLLSWAKITGAYIVEWDTYGEFCYDGSPLPSLFSLDADSRVIYVNSFSAWIGAGLNLGYLVVPAELARGIIALKKYLDPLTPWLDQRMTAEFILSDSFFGHLRRVRQTFKSRRDALVGAINAIAGQQNVTGQDAGRHLVWHLPGSFQNARTLQSKAAEHGIILPTLFDAYCQVGAINHYFNPDSVVLLGYQAMPEEKILEGISRLSAAWALS